MNKLVDKNGKPVGVGDLIKLDDEFGPIGQLRVYRTQSLFSGRSLWYGARLPPADPTPQLIADLNHRFVLVEVEVDA